MMTTRTAHTTAIIVTILVPLFVWLIGRYSAAGFGRFQTKEFWSLFGSALGPGFVIIGMVTIMSQGGPNIKEPFSYFASLGWITFLVYSLIALVVSYYLNRPENIFYRTLLGLMAYPIACVMVMSLLMELYAMAKK